MQSRVQNVKFETETQQKVASQPSKPGVNFRGGEGGSWKPIALLHSKFSLAFWWKVSTILDVLQAMKKFAPCENCSRCTGKMFDWLRAFCLFYFFCSLATMRIFTPHTHSRAVGDSLVWVTMKCSHNAAHLYLLVLSVSVCCFLLSVFCFLLLDLRRRLTLHYCVM